MLFKRRDKQRLSKKIREALWPTMGWERAYLYFKHRIMRRGAMPAEITSGLAIGAGVSFTPLLGTHFAQAVFFSWLFRANMLAGFVGTAVGNPWTFPAMFWLSYKVGEAVFRYTGFGEMIALPDVLTLEYLLANPLRLLVPMTLGGYVCAIISWPIFYALLYWPVKVIHRTYHHQKSMRRQSTSEIRP